MAPIADFRVYQSAAKNAKRAGVPQRDAVHQVAEAIREGMTGQHVAGQLQHLAMRAASHQPGPAAA